MAEGLTRLERERERQERLRREAGVLPTSLRPHIWSGGFCALCGMNKGWPGAENGCKGVRFGHKRFNQKIRK